MCDGTNYWGNKEQHLNKSLSLYSIAIVSLSWIQWTWGHLHAKVEYLHNEKITRVELCINALYSANCVLDIVKKGAAGASASTNRTNRSLHYQSRVFWQPSSQLVSCSGLNYDILLCSEIKFLYFAW